MLTEMRLHPGVQIEIRCDLCQVFVNGSLQRCCRFIAIAAACGRSAQHDSLELWIDLATRAWRGDPADHETAHDVFGRHLGPELLARGGSPQHATYGIDIR